MEGGGDKEAPEALAKSQPHQAPKVKGKSLGQLRLADPVPHTLLVLHLLGINQVSKATSPHLSATQVLLFLGTKGHLFLSLGSWEQRHSYPSPGYSSSNANTCLGMLALSTLVGQ